MLLRNRWTENCKMFFLFFFISVWVLRLFSLKLFLPLINITSAHTTIDKRIFCFFSSFWWFLVHFHLSTIVDFFFLCLRFLFLCVVLLIFKVLRSWSRRSDAIHQQTTYFSTYTQLNNYWKLFFSIISKSLGWVVTTITPPSHDESQSDQIDKSKSASSLALIEDPLKARHRPFFIPSFSNSKIISTWLNYSFSFQRAWIDNVFRRQTPQNQKIIIYVFFLLYLNPEKFLF